MLIRPDYLTARFDLQWVAFQAEANPDLLAHRDGIGRAKQQHAASPEVNHLGLEVSPRRFYKRFSFNKMAPVLAPFGSV